MTTNYQGSEDIQPLGNGLINKTYQITHTHENEEEKQYVLQAINHDIFKKRTWINGKYRR